MEYTDYMIWKLIGLCVLVAAWQFWRGLNGHPYEVPTDKPAEPPQD
jgi:hypothetical protein